MENTCEQQNQEEASIILQRNLFKFMNVCTELVRSSKIIEIQEAVRLNHHPLRVDFNLKLIHFVGFQIDMRSLDYFLGRASIDQSNL